MGFFPRVVRSFGLILLVAGGAEAAELMHMPFACHFDGARVHLRPSEERTYAIIGRYEREIFTACSPSDPETCRNWFVHRFDFDCDGDRVAWLDAATAAARHTDWDAWVEDGRFRMRMNAMWGVARARPMPPRRRFMQRRYMEREDAFEDGYGASTVTAPPGFAPAVGIPLTFSGGAPEVAEMPAEAEIPGAATQQAPAVAAYAAEPAPPPRPDLPERAPTKEQRLAAASPPPVVAPAPKLATEVEVTDDPSQGPPLSKTPDAKAAEGVAAKAEKGPADETARESAAAAAKPGGLTVLNAPRATGATPAATSAQSEIAAARIETSAVAAPAGLGTQQPATPAASGNSEAHAQATPEPAAPDSAPLFGTELPALSPETVMGAAATTLALAGLAFFGVQRWRRRPPETAPVNRDIADISLGGGHRALPPASRAAQAEPAAPIAEGPSREVGDDASALPVPTTYAEALEVLGASPDASTGAIKKIVDGLRQSWHPDLARSEADRLHREARVRQINVAWDLVSQRRSAA